MSGTRLRRLPLALVTILLASLVAASLGAGAASANDCSVNNLFQMGVTNICNSPTALNSSAVVPFKVTSSAPFGSGLVGIASAATGTNLGVYGESDSNDSGSAGVDGRLNSATPGASFSAGVLGESNSTTANGPGVWGEHFDSSGTAPGVLGETNSTSANAVAVQGRTTSISPGTGATAVRGINNGTSANGYGVWGSQAGSGTGVLGQSSSGIGVLGYSNFVGLLGYAPAGGYAGYFAGDAVVSGTLYKGAGAFRIDHPLDPAHKYLQHSFVESPEMMDVYNGNVTTDSKGFATVKLPAYFQALNRSFRYQLTIVGSRGWRARVVKEIAGNRFTIQSDVPGTKVSWQVTGVRHDAYANAHRIPVVLQKPAKEQGKYLHPELYGKPGSQTVVPKIATKAIAQARR